MARRIGGNPRKTRVTPFAAPPLLLLDGTIDVKQSSPLASGGPVTSLSATFSAMPKAGSAIVVQVAAYEETSYNALVAGDCTDNQGNTYSLAFVQADPDAGANDARSSIAVFYVFDIPAPTGTAFTVTIGRPGTNNWFARARIHEVTGIDTLDATATETASGTSTSPTVTTGTPANADSIMFGVLSTDDGSSDTGIDLPSEWLTEWRDNDGSAIVSSMAAHKTINSATAQTYSGGALTASESWAIGVAVFSPSAANYELTITKGDLVLTGRNVAFAVDLPVANGNLALTGQAVALEAGFNLLLTKADLVLSGQNVNFTLDLPVSKGDLALSGQNVALEAGFVLPVTKADLTLTGGAVGFAVDLPLAKGDLALAGQSVALTAGFNLDVTAGALTLAGQSIGFAVDLPVSATTLTLAGGTLALEIALPVSAGALALAGQSVGWAIDLPLTKADLALTGGDITLQTDNDIELPITAGQLMLSGGSIDLVAFIPAGTDEATPGVIAQQWAEAIQRYKAELEAEERERQEKSSIAPTPEGARSSPEAPQTSPTDAQTIKRAASLAVEQGIKPDAELVAMAFAVAQERAAAYVAALQQEMALIEEEETIFMLIAASASAGASI